MSDAGSPRVDALVSCEPTSRALALAELAPLVATPTAIRWLDEGLAMTPAPAGFDAFAADVDRAAPVFIRHICPAEIEVPLTAAEGDIGVLVRAAAGLAGRLDPARTFSVQTRILGEGKRPYRRVVVNEMISTWLEANTKMRMDCREPGQVISVLCAPTQGWLGVSRTEQNRSAWPGGMHRFKDEDGQISRAEHKLLEAIGVFHLALPPEGTALDMGAAPGGWTRVLRQRGLKVVAVDPADLDLRLRGDTGIMHVRGKIEAYLSASRRFDVLVNDMRMDAADSVSVMLQARPRLVPGGLAIPTLKLLIESETAARTLGTVRDCLARISRSYTVLGARQLFHNRSEVTVALRATG